MSSISKMSTSSHRRDSYLYHHRNFIDPTISITTCTYYLIYNSINFNFKAETFSIPEECEDDGFSDEDKMTVLQISKPLTVCLPPHREIRFEDIDYNVYEKSYLRPTRCFLAKKRTKSDFDMRSDSTDWVKFAQSIDSIDFDDSSTNNGELMANDDEALNENLNFEKWSNFHVGKDKHGNEESSEKFKRISHRRSHSEEFTFKSYNGDLNINHERTTIEKSSSRNNNARTSLDSVSSDDTTAQFYTDHNLTLNHHQEQNTTTKEPPVVVQDKIEDNTQNYINVVEHKNRKFYSMAADSARDFHVLKSPQQKDNNNTSSSTNAKNINVDLNYKC